MHDKTYYEKLGFKCGLEIHQRLSVSKKLFCNCDAHYDKGSKIGDIERRQRAVTGELGGRDVSAEFESMKKKRFRYNIFDSKTCLVDIDEEPPQDLNAEALDIAMLISKSLNADVPDEIEPMRKGVVDGSDPSAFQRSMLVGYDGNLKIDKVEVGIPTIFLEEESCGIVAHDGDSVTYDTDRLGIPLIEIDTDPIIHTPIEAKNVARTIGLILRLSGKVQRGIGSIRQDVNISIIGGTRVEIKGFQDIEHMDEVIDKEIERQIGLIEIKNILKNRNAEVGIEKELSHVFMKTSAKIIRDQMSTKGIVIGLRLAGFAGLLSKEIGKGMRLGREMSDYAKTSGVKGIIHSDEKLDAYGISSDEMSDVKKELNVIDDDAFVLIVGKEDVCREAIRMVKIRAEMAFEGVPSETRAVSNEQTTRFLRPIPTGSRMYPETDVLPIVPSKKTFDKIDIKKTSVVLRKEIGIEQLAEQMLWSKYLHTYEDIRKRTGADPLVISVTLLEKFRELKRSGIDVDMIDDQTLVAIFNSYKEGVITKAGIEEILKRTPRNQKEVKKIIESEKLERISGSELKELVHKFEGTGRDKIRRIMEKYRLNIDGEELSKIVNRDDDGK